MNDLFNEIVNREDTYSIKWDQREELFNSKDVLPMWVADMDFKSPKPVLDALASIIERGVLGYTYPTEPVYEAIMDWQKNKHAMALKKEHILFSPGVVPSLGLAVQALTKEGDSVLIHDPVYPPFTEIVKKNNRNLVRSSLVIEDGQYKMNLEEMETLIVEQDVKLFFLCHPHNPGGRVWSKEELIQVSDLCLKHNVILVSDEIHGDLIYPDVEFVSPVTLNPAYEDIVITLASVTKTFNLAGIKNSMMFIFSDALREKVKAETEKLECCAINTFGLVGTEVAFREGDAWLDKLLAVMHETRQVVTDFFDTHLPDVFYMVPEATYLLWFDVSTLGIADEELVHHFAECGNIGLNDGISYGPHGSQFMRLNFAAPHAVVVDGLNRIKQAFDASKKQ